MRNLFLLLFLLLVFRLSSEVNYQVTFQGTEDKEMVEVLQSVSQLYLLRDHPPATKIALSRRADADLPNLVQGLQSLGYYDPKIHADIDFERDPALVVIQIDPGLKYSLGSLKIFPSEECVTTFPFETISPGILGLHRGRVILPKEILDAEVLLLGVISRKGYPLATITKREVIADQNEKNISLVFYVNTGPQAYFGPTKISGLTCVLESVIEKKIRWKEGCPYHPQLVERTLTAIEASGLFSTVAIYPEDQLNEQGLLPIHIDVSERKHRTVALGISYNTQLGGWFNRRMGKSKYWTNREKAETICRPLVHSTTGGSFIFTA